MTVKRYAGDKITCLSSDPRPNNVTDGTTLYELDTKRVYFRYGGNWVEIETSLSNTDVTTISTTAGTFGSNTVIPVITVAANGRIINITNVSVVSSGSSQDAFDRANDAYALANTANNLALSAYNLANSANTLADTAFDSADLANNLAQAAFDKANTDNTDINITAGTFGNSTVIPVITVAANGRVTSVSNTTITTSSGVTKFRANVGNASATSFNVSHNLNTQDIVVSVSEWSSRYFVYPDVYTIGNNNIGIEFASAPTTNQYTVLVIGA